MKLYEEPSESELKKQKLELIAKILDYPEYKSWPIEKKVKKFDYLYDKELSELKIYSKVYTNTH